MPILIFQLIVLLFSAIVHEVAHGVMAERLGDPTARLAGRITLNPLKHLDMFGSFIMPLSLFLISGGSFVFGWAKPVPYNPYNLKNPKRDIGFTALAGALSNFALAIVFSIFYRLAAVMPYSFLGSLLPFFELIIFINISLGVFNLVPLPPLDGSKVLFAILPESAREIQIFLERYGMMIFVFFLFFGFRLIWPIIFFLHNLLI